MATREIEARALSLYGDVDWASAKGLLHVTAIADRSRAVIALGPAAPISATDRFVLGLARARADTILTTGAILRSEPALVHRYAEDEAQNEAFHDWRREVCGLVKRPALIVISRSGDFPLDHPALAATEDGIIWTSQAGHARLGESVGRLSVEEGIAASSTEGGKVAESLGSLLRVARSRLAAETILLEAGPTLSREFYRSDGAGCPRVDELLLSSFEGELAGEAIGPPFESAAEISRRFPDSPTRLRVEEPGGTWRFERYRATSEG